MKNSATLRYLFALFLYGTIGFFLHFTQYSSEFVVLCRGLLGSLFIVLVLCLRRQKIDSEAIRKNLKLLVISGFALGFNWVFLFAGYRYGMAISSLMNYMAPIAVVVISAILYKEKIYPLQIFFIVMAFIGMLLLTGIFEQQVKVDMHCVVYGLLAAAGFVILVLCNRKLEGIDPLEKTLVQLFSSAMIVFPYVLFNHGFPDRFDMLSTVIVLVLGFLHTGVAYICYFSSINVLPPQSIALLGYLEPVLNFVIGVFVFHEPLGLLSIIGAVFIVAASLGNELAARKQE